MLRTLRRARRRRSSIWWSTSPSPRERQKIGVVSRQEQAKQLGIIGRGGSDHARPCGEVGTPGTDLRQVLPDPQIGKSVEQVKVAEDRCEHRVDQAEPRTGEEGSIPEYRLDPGEPGGDGGQPGFEHGSVLRCLQMPNVVQDG